MIPKIPKNIDDTFEKGLEKATEAGNKTIETATNQSDETTQAFLDQLYGPTSPSPQMGTEQSRSTEPSKLENPQQQQSPAMEQLQTEQEKLAKARAQLNKFDVNYHQQFDLEQTLARVRQEKDAEAVKKQQDEAREAERKRQEEAANVKPAQTPAGKRTGMPGGQKRNMEVQDLDAQRARQAIENKSGFKG